MYLVARRWAQHSLYLHDFQRRGHALLVIIIHSLTPQKPVALGPEYFEALYDFAVLAVQRALSGQWGTIREELEVAPENKFAPNTSA